MTHFLDGPAAGVKLILQRAPQYLRVVRDPAGTWDALDQLDDAPDPGEVVFAYRMKSFDGSAHYCGRDAKGRRFGRWERSATYEFIQPQPEPVWLSTTPHWRAWVEAEGPCPAALAQQPETPTKDTTEAAP